MALSYQWFEDGFAVGTDSNVYSGTATEVKQVTVYCEVSNEAGSVISDIVTFTVQVGAYSLGVFHGGIIKELIPDQIQYGESFLEAGQDGALQNGNEENSTHR